MINIVSHRLNKYVISLIFKLKIYKKKSSVYIFLNCLVLVWTTYEHTFYAILNNISIKMYDFIHFFYCKKFVNYRSFHV